MKLVQSPFIKAFLDSANKKFLLEVPHSRVSLAKDSKLEPLRDLDDRIISFSPFNKNVKYTQPSEYEDCFERMSFERPADEVDIWRDNELYRVGHESRAYINEPYSSDDVELAENISNKIYSHHNCRVPSSYYPDTDMSYDCKVGLKLLDFTENIVPSSFPRNMNVNYDTIRSYSRSAVNAWENGVPTSEIPKLINKSILKSGEGKVGIADVDLFNFLIKYPNQRSVAVLASSNGKELFDKSAALYYDIFTKKYFADSEVVRSILDECKTVESGFPKVNNKMCEIVTLLRRKSALGIAEKQVKTYSYMMPKPPEKCSINTPWGKAESELLKKLKPQGTLDEDYYTAAKSMLVEDKETVDCVLKNIDAVADKVKEINKIEQKYVCPENLETQKSEILKMLKSDLAKNRRKPESLATGCQLIDMAKVLQKNFVPMTDFYRILKIMDSLSQSRQKDVSYFSDAINQCMVSKVRGKDNTRELANLCCRLYQATGDFGKNEAEVIENICNHVKKGDDNYISALKTLITLNSLPKNCIIKIADTNLDEFAKYMKRFNAATEGNEVFASHINFIKSAIAPEMKRFASLDKVNSDDSVVLNELEMLCSNKISYIEFLEHLRILGVSFK